MIWYRRLKPQKFKDKPWEYEWLNVDKHLKYYQVDFMNFEIKIFDEVYHEYSIEFGAAFEQALIWIKLND